MSKKQLTLEEELAIVLQKGGYINAVVPESIDFKLSTGSLILDVLAGGGVGPGIIRFCGDAGGGKTYQALTLMENWFKLFPNAYGLFLDAEGKFSRPIYNHFKNTITFVGKEEGLQHGKCLTVSPLSYDDAANTINPIINRPFDEGGRCLIILDSLDALELKSDQERDLSDPTKIAGAAVMTKKMLTRLSAKLYKHGHLLVLVSQRSMNEIKTNQYQASNSQGGINVSGGNAAWHYPSDIWDYQAANTQNRRFVVDPSKRYHPKDNPYVGHLAKIKMVKSSLSNAPRGHEVEYPINHATKRVWLEKEIIDILLSGIGQFPPMLNRSGSWLAIEPSLKESVEKETGIEIPEKLQGEHKWLQFLEENETVKIFLYNFIIASEGIEDTVLADYTETKDETTVSEGPYTLP